MPEESLKRGKIAHRDTPRWAQSMHVSEVNATQNNHWRRAFNGLSDMDRAIIGRYSTIPRFTRI